MFRRCVVLVLAVALLAGCSKLTKKNYAKLKSGMSVEEVTSILGEPDSCTEALFVRSCQWGDEKRNVSVNFVGGKVMLLTSHNLR
jgi:hypothetical protein